MAMLSQSGPLMAMGCPAGVCRQQGRAWTQTRWKALAAGFAAGALLVSAAIALAGVTAAPNVQRVDADREAAAARWAAVVREQPPSELPREWRWKIKPVNVDGMFRKQR